MFKRISLAIAVAALVAGCSSGVDLDNAPVEDRAGSALPTTGSNGAGSGSTGQSSVAGVDLSQSARDAAGPVGAGKVVHFDYDSYVIRADYQDLIETHAKFIKAAPSRKVMLEGHTDERGSRAYNQALGERRGNGVNSALQANGGSASQLTVVSYGEERPVCTESNESCWSQNRRVEIVYTAQ